MLLSGGRRRGQGRLSHLAAGRGRYRGICAHSAARRNVSGGLHRPRDRREAALRSGEANCRRGHRHGEREAARR